MHKIIDIEKDKVTVIITLNKLNLKNKERKQRYRTVDVLEFLKTEYPELSLSRTLKESFIKNYEEPNSGEWVFSLVQSESSSKPVTEPVSAAKPKRQRQQKAAEKADPQPATSKMVENDIEQKASVKNLQDLKTLSRKQ
jgi:hypothetical protein